MFAAIAVFMCCLAGEVVCLSGIAFMVYIFGTARIEDYGMEHVKNIINFILDFIQKGRDKKLRIISINKGLGHSLSYNIGK